LRPAPYLSRKLTVRTKDGGVHPKVASKSLGHSKVGITLHLYSRVLRGMQAEAAAAVDGALQAAQQRRTQILANRLQTGSVLTYENKKS
jgi:hypothetical protein